jgi:hypothetical protein
MKKTIALISLLYISVQSSLAQAMILQPCPYRGFFVPTKQQQQKTHTIKIAPNKQNTQKAQPLMPIRVAANSNPIKK